MNTPQATGDRHYEPPQISVIGSITELTHIGESNPKIGTTMDGMNQNQLGKTSTWPN